MSRPSASVPVPIADGEEFFVDVDYEFHPGSPATHELAADPDEVDVLFYRIDGEPAPAWLVKLIRDFIDGWLLDHHQEEGPDPDRAYDARRNGDGETLVERLSA